MCKTTKWRLKPFWVRVWGVVVGVAWHLVHVICLLTPYISWIIPTEPCTLYNHCIPEYTFNHYMSNKSFNAFGQIKPDKNRQSWVRLNCGSRNAAGDGSTFGR